MPLYTIKYKVKSTVSTRAISLQSGTESEAIAKLKQQCSVPKDANVILLSIKKR